MRCTPFHAATRAGAGEEAAPQTAGGVTDRNDGEESTPSSEREVNEFQTDIEALNAYRTLPLGRESSDRDNDEDNDFR